MNDDQLNSEWARWDEVMRSIAFHMSRNDFTSGLEKVNTFLFTTTIPEVQSSALGMRADIELELGYLDSAKEDLRAARSLIGPGFGRYVHELCLAEIYARQGRIEEARIWYRTALHTCLEANISGGGALGKLLELQHGEEFREEDRKLSLAVAEQSWRVLGLRGTPNFTDLARVTSAIRDGEANPKGASSR